MTRGREAFEEQDGRGAPRAIFTQGQKDGLAEVSRTRSAEVGAVATSMDWASLLGHASDGCSQPLHALPQLLTRGVIAGLPLFQQYDGTSSNIATTNWTTYYSWPTTSKSHTDGLGQPCQLPG